MKNTITERLLSEHIVEGKLAPGQEIGITIDQTLTHDATGILTFLGYEAIGAGRVKTEVSVHYTDHSTLQTDAGAADGQRFLQSSAAKYGIVFSPAGNGISHHVHLERFGKAGKTLLGSDSHTTTGGCLCMLAIGAGGIDVARAMAGNPFYFQTPKVWGIYLERNLEPFVSGKDVALDLLRRYSCKAGIGKIMEFFGPGVANLDISARATIANMAADMGCTAAIFPSDEQTRRHFELNDRQEDWREITHGPFPKFEEITEIDLSTVEPLVACPRSPDNVKRVAELQRIDLHQVIIGSSCNGSYRDLMIASKIIEGHVRHPRVNLEINPGSRQALYNITTMGGMIIFINAGARIHEAGCIGMGQVPATGTVSLRTFSRNFPGRSGARNDRVFLCSPETAAASALAGKIIDPRIIGECPAVEYPAQFFRRKEWFIYPPVEGIEVKIPLRTAVKPLPKFKAMTDSLTCEVLIKIGDNVSTDMILHAGTKTHSLHDDIQGLSEFVFEPMDPGFTVRALRRGDGIVIAGENFGHGPSREHAALAPRYLGIRVALAKSFARIHRANLINSGILPLIFVKKSDFRTINQGNAVRIEDIKRALTEGTEKILLLVRNQTIHARLDLSGRERRILLAGGILNLYEQQD